MRHFGAEYLAEHERNVFDLWSFSGASGRLSYLVRHDRAVARSQGHLHFLLEQDGSR